MGCGTSKNVMKRLKEQDQKIDKLTQINRNLEERIRQLNQNAANEQKQNNDTHDITYLKSTIDSRFTKLEKNVGQIHNEFKMKMFEGIPANPEEANAKKMHRINSMSLDFGKESQKQIPEKYNKDGQVQWNELLHESNMTARKLSGDKLGNNEEVMNVENSNLMNNVEKMKYFSINENIVNPNDINMDFNTIKQSPNLVNSVKTNPDANAKDILEDDEIKRIHNEVRNMMFKGTKNPY